MYSQHSSGCVCLWHHAAKAARLYTKHCSSSSNRRLRTLQLPSRYTAQPQFGCAVLCMYCVQQPREPGLLQEGRRGWEGSLLSLLCQEAASWRLLPPLPPLYPLLWVAASSAIGGLWR